MPKKRKTDAPGLEEVEKTLFSSFCAAANSISHLYSLAQSQQRAAFHAGERHALMRLQQLLMLEANAGGAATNSQPNVATNSPSQFVHREKILDFIQGELDRIEEGWPTHPSEGGGAVGVPVAARHGPIDSGMLRSALGGAAAHGGLGAVGPGAVRHGGQPGGAGGTVVSHSHLLSQLDHCHIRPQGGADGCARPVATGGGGGVGAGLASSASSCWDSAAVGDAAGGSPMAGRLPAISLLFRQPDDGPGDAARLPLSSPSLSPPPLLPDGIAAAPASITVAAVASRTGEGGGPSTPVGASPEALQDRSEFHQGQPPPSRPRGPVAMPGGRLDLQLGGLSVAGAVDGRMGHRAGCESGALPALLGKRGNESLGHAVPTAGGLRPYPDHLRRQQQQQITTDPMQQSARPDAASSFLGAQVNMQGDQTPAALGSNGQSLGSEQQGHEQGVLDQGPFQGALARPGSFQLGDVQGDTPMS